MNNMCESFPAAQRILSDIGIAFKRDSKLREFHILPVIVNENKSPVHHIDHSLGLESWCVPHLYCYVYNTLMDIKQQKRRQEDLEHLNQLLIGALLLNPDSTVLWNMRRELSAIDLQFELRFTYVVLTRKPKCAEVFSYRKWLIQKTLKDVSHDLGLVTAEVHVCQLAAELYANNYYAWSHRIWCVNQLPPDSGALVSFLVNEWMQTHRWVSTHVSDHSGFHYRQYLLEKFVTLSPVGYDIVKTCTSDIEKKSIMSLKMFLSPSEAKQDKQLTESTKSLLLESSESVIENLRSVPLGLILSEFLLNTDLINVFPGHEAIWYHRRFIIYIFKEFVQGLKLLTSPLDHDLKDNNGVSLEKSKRVESIGESLIQRLICFETALYSLCKTTKDRQASNAEKHRAWLASIMKINLHLPIR